MGALFASALKLELVLKKVKAPGKTNKIVYLFQLFMPVRDCKGNDLTQQKGFDPKKHPNEDNRCEHLLFGAECFFAQGDDNGRRNEG